MSKYAIGYTCGCFDLFHVGHIRLLERCSEMCEKLIVGICDDNYMIKHKGRKGIYNQNDRLEIVKALKCVYDAIIITEDETIDKLSMQKKLGFDVLFSGDDWKGSDRYKKIEEDFQKIGVSVEYFPYTTGVSTSDIIKRIKETE